MKFAKGLLLAVLIHFAAPVAVEYVKTNYLNHGVYETHQAGKVPRDNAAGH